ncbi:MAG: hypothetical protein AABZ53_10785 [Planctomycetota bacterium]
MASASTLDHLFNTWCKHLGNPLAIAAELNVTPSELIALIGTSEFTQRREIWETITLAHRNAMALHHQRAASERLHEALDARTDPIETRRTATVLMRLCNSILSPSTPRAVTPRTSAPPVAAAPRLNGHDCSSASHTNDPHSGAPTPDPSPQPSTPATQPIASTSPQPFTTPSPQPDPASFPLPGFRPIFDQILENPALALELSTIAKQRTNPTGIVAKLAALTAAAGTCQPPAPVARASSP